MLVLVLWLDYVDVCGGGVLDYVVTGFGYSVIGRGGKGKGWGERIEAKCVG